MSENDLEHAIAIIGMSGKFPGADDIQTFWKNLCEGKDTITSFSDEELLAEGLPKSLIQSKSYVKSRGILKGTEMFDADFFGFKSKEVQMMDPQHRLFLECCWEALENAGYCSDNYSGSIGVYGGTGNSSYYLNNIHPNRQLRESLEDFLLHISNDKDFLTTRVSYKLNLKGPSLTVQTACSTSLVAVCLACNHLLTYQCDMALAGGVSISVPQINGYAYQEGMILSENGQCRPFDAEATGTVMSNGVGIVVLKRLQDAIEDKDHIYAVIRGFGINNDGSGKIGYSAPSMEGQAEAIISAFSMADIDPETISYAEAHGTGTILGDPIEIQGLTTAFHTTKKQYCAIGSVKSNIGHTVEAAGVISLIKAVLALYYQKIPPSLHFNKSNPYIDFAETPFYVNTVLKEWKTVEYPRRASVSSFGIGGTNAHTILEEWPQRISDSSLTAYPLILSAKTLSALKRMGYNLSRHLQQHPELSLADVAYTLQIGRKLFEHKRLLVCRDKEEAISLLLNFDPANYSITPMFAQDIFKDKQCCRVPLPTYPFEKKRYWIDPPKTVELPISEGTHFGSLETELLNIFKEFLETESIGVEDDFFQLGGDSLLAIQVAERLSKQFNMSLGMQTLLRHPTVAKLAQLISSQKFATSSIIKLRPGNADSSIFLLPPIEGNLFCYKNLVSRLKCPKTIYGIEAVDAETKSIEEIASSYIENIRKIQPNGPYNLIGMSFGGIIAYEMATQLEKNGISVSFLCMIDVINPNFAGLSSLNENELLKYLIELLNGKPFLKEEINAEEVAQSLGLEMLSSNEKEHIFKRINIYLRALSHYKPKPYGGKILFFEAIQRFFRHTNVTIGSSWKKLVNERIEIQEIPGNHATILMPPQVDFLVNILDIHLNQRLKK